MGCAAGSAALSGHAAGIKARVSEWVRDWVRASPGRAAITGLGESAWGFRWLNALAGANGVFRSFPEAHRAARQLALGGHDEPSQSDCYSHVFRQSDYPVLYWLARLAPASLFDFGGAMGALRHLYAAYLESVHTIDWTVYDLPAIVERAATRERNRDTPLRFTSDLTRGAGCDVLLASGSLHYWEHPVAALFHQMGWMPEHVLINRSPMTDRAAYCLVQRLPQVALPCVVRNRAELTAELASLGYTCVDQWTEPARTITVPLFPAYDVDAYYGFYFRRAEAAQIHSRENRHV